MIGDKKEFLSYHSPPITYHLVIMLQAIPEKQPALLTLVYVGGFLLVALMLGVSLLRHARARRSGFAGVALDDLPEECGGVSASPRPPGLKALRWVFRGAGATGLGFHV